MGLLTGRARLELLADADVVVYPSADEVFGLVPLEALLCGTPVVVADDSGCGEVVGPLDGGQVVAVGDPVALAAAIDRVLASPHAWRARAASGAARFANDLAGRWWQNKSMPCIGKSSLADAGVSVVVPVLNGARWLPDVLAAIRAELAGRAARDPRDRRRQPRRVGRDLPRRTTPISGHRRPAPGRRGGGEYRAAAGALRPGRADRSGRDREARLVRRRSSTRCATRRSRPRRGGTSPTRRPRLLARVMSIDLEQRYARIDGGASDHVCTGNVIWRLDALRGVGVLDESLGTGTTTT